MWTGIQIVVLHVSKTFVECGWVAPIGAMCFNLQGDLSHAK